MTGGWFLLQGFMVRKGAVTNAPLILEAVDSHGKTSTFRIPVSFKGTIFELIQLPEGITECSLQAHQSIPLNIRDISLSRVGRIERVFRMYRRVVPMLMNQPRERLQKTGLSFFSLLFDPQKAYRNAGRIRDCSTEHNYEKWLEENDVLTNKDIMLIRKQMKGWLQSPFFEVFILIRDDSLECFEATITSLRSQLYREFNITLLIPPQVNSKIDLARLPSRVAVYKATSFSDMVAFVNVRIKKSRKLTFAMFLQVGVTLSNHALYWFAKEAISNRDTAFIYSDHDRLGLEGIRFGPHFKPDWSPELLRSTNYIGPSAAVRTDVLMRAGGLKLSDVRFDPFHALYLRISEQVPAESICHIPSLLWHIPKVVDEGFGARPKQKPDPVSVHFRRLGISASVTEFSTGRYRVRYDLPNESPMVSILLPTRDALGYLRSCVESVLSQSSYRNFEILVIDNQSKHPKTLKYLDKLEENPQVRVLRYRKEFNYSAINNFAARRARGGVLCLLNNDTEVISANWMEEMLGHLLQPGIGVVGAKLYYGDGRVQHAGDAVGPGGCADHLHSMLERDDPGYCHRAILAQDLSAVTAACLMTWKDLYLELNGLDARNLPIAFNDVDYCLRVREQGLRVIWTPYAELYHYESVSRSKYNNAERQSQLNREAGYMRRRWKHLMSHDPFYNPNLSYDRPDFSLNTTPLVKKPWRG